MIRMRSKGFTLIELLVVVAIIALLAALLAPMLARAKRRAKVIVCSGQLEQFAEALMCYARENETYFPHRRAGTRSDDDLALLLVKKYVTTIDLYRCPSSLHDDPETTEHVAYKSPHMLCRW